MRKKKREKKIKSKKFPYWFFRATIFPFPFPFPFHVVLLNFLRCILRWALEIFIQQQPLPAHLERNHGHSGRRVQTLHVIAQRDEQSFPETFPGEIVRADTDALRLPANDQNDGVGLEVDIMVRDGLQVGDVAAGEERNAAGRAGVEVGAGGFFFEIVRQVDGRGIGEKVAHFLPDYLIFDGNMKMGAHGAAEHFWVPRIDAALKINQSTNQSINRRINQKYKQSIKKSIKKSINQTITMSKHEQPVEKTHTRLFSFVYFFSGFVFRLNMMLWNGLALNEK